MLCASLASYFTKPDPANIYLSLVNNRNTKKVVKYVQS